MPATICDSMSPRTPGDPPGARRRLGLLSLRRGRGLCRGAAPDPGLKAATSAASACSRLIEADGVVTPATPLSSLIGATNGLLTSNEFDGPSAFAVCRTVARPPNTNQWPATNPRAKLVSEMAPWQEIARLNLGAGRSGCGWRGPGRHPGRSTGRSQEENRNVFNVSLVTFGHKELSERHLVAPFATTSW